MSLVSQVSTQKASIKQHKIHRATPEISRKIIAFEEIIMSNKTKSHREITEILNVPNSTMQEWQKKKRISHSKEDELDIFFSTPVGSNFLCRMVIAVMYGNKCGASGINGVKEMLHNSGLDKYVATSDGALQKFWIRCENCILQFGEEWEQKLAEKMKAKNITVILDEMFRKGKPCLVAIEAVSNYILLEKFTEDRTTETWEKELKNATKHFAITIGSVTSDLCGALRSLANKYLAIHIPDVFHGLYEISKATSAPMNSQERSLEKLLNEAASVEKKLINIPKRLGIEDRKQQQKDLEETINKHEILKVKHEEAKARREKTQEAKKELGRIYHPINLETGKIQSAEIAEQKFKEQFDVIRKNAKEAKLAQPSHNRIEKSKRAFDLIVQFLMKFFFIFEAILLDMRLMPDQEIFFKEIAFPLAYLNMIWRRLPKKEKERLSLLRQGLQQKLESSPFTEEFKEALFRRGKETAEIFQRSSSCVEGRNGTLSLIMHRFHHLSPRSLRALSIVHNFVVKRQEDGSTAAERFFGAKHNNLFDCLIDHVRIPGRPQVQNRRKDMKAA